MEVLDIVVNSVIGLAVAGMWAYMAGFVREQRSVNRANALANRSMQRDVLYRYFRAIVEEGTPVTPEEWAHVQDCYEAYHANGGNGAGTLMFERMREHVRIDTGRS